MINEVPIRIMEAARAVTLRHPNSMDCKVFRKVVVRPQESGETTMGGLGTIGGIGVTSSEDEAEFEYQDLGDAKILITSRYEGTADMVDRGDAVTPEILQESQIEPVPADGVAPFEVKKNDLIGVMPGGGVVIGFEIVAVTGSVAIYPYTTKFIISPRDDLHSLQPWSEG